MFIDFYFDLATVIFQNVNQLINEESFVGKINWCGYFRMGWSIFSGNAWQKRRKSAPPSHTMVDGKTAPSKVISLAALLDLI
jgi:hypothetical protein